MQEQIQFVLSCLENVSSEQLVMWGATAALGVASHFGWRLTRSAAIGVGSLFMGAVRGAAWCVGGPEASPAAKAAMEALDDPEAVYEGGILACTGLAVVFKDADPKYGVRSAGTTNNVAIWPVLTRKEKKRFDAKARAKAAAVIERDRQAANEAAALVIARHNKARA